MKKDTDKLYLFGHESIPALKIKNLYKTITADINDLDFIGYIKVNEGGATGMSGGPVFQGNGKLVGIIRDVAANESTVIPIDSIFEHFKLLGIHFNLDAHVKEIDTIPAIYNKITQLEQLALDLQSNLKWFLEPRLLKRKGGREKLELKFQYEYTLASQSPLPNTLCHLEITPYIEGLEIDPKKLKVTDKQWIINPDKSVTFSNVLLSISEVVGRIAKRKDINIAKALKIIEANLIYRVHGQHSFSNIQVERKVCFTIACKSNRLSKGIRSEGINCSFSQKE